MHDRVVTSQNNTYTGTEIIKYMYIPIEGDRIVEYAILAKCGGLYPKGTGQGFLRWLRVSHKKNPKSTDKTPYLKSFTFISF